MQKRVATLRFLFYSLVGIVAFFVPLSINGKSTILMDHIVSFITDGFLPLAHLYTAVPDRARSGPAVYFRPVEVIEDFGVVVVAAGGGASPGRHLFFGPGSCFPDAARYAAFPV